MDGHLRRHQHHQHHGLHSGVHQYRPPPPHHAAPQPAGSSAGSGGGGGASHSQSPAGAAAADNGGRALIRLKRDLAEMRQDGELFTCGHALTDIATPDPQGDPMRLHVTFKFTQGVFKHAVVQFELCIPPTYPFAPPQVRCLTPVWHPQVELRTGRVGFPLLAHEWKPVLALGTLILGLQLLFLEPGIDDTLPLHEGPPQQPAALNPLAAAALREDPGRYAQQVAETLQGGEFVGVQFPWQRPAPPTAVAGGVPLAAAAAATTTGGGRSWASPSLARKRKMGLDRRPPQLLGPEQEDGVVLGVGECSSAPPEEDLEAMRIDDDDEGGEGRRGQEEEEEEEGDDGRAGGGGRSKKRLCCSMDGASPHKPPLLSPTPGLPPPPVLGVGSILLTSPLHGPPAAAFAGAGGSHALQPSPPPSMVPGHGGNADVNVGPASSGLFAFPTSPVPRQPAPAGAL